jgi:hypothetical protein
VTYCIGLLSVRLRPDNNGYTDEKQIHINKASNRWNCAIDGQVDFSTHEDTFDFK